MTTMRFQCRLLTLAAVICFPASESMAQATRPVAVTVTAHRFDGLPLADLPIILESSNGVIGMGKSNEGGSLVLQAMVPSSDAVVGVSLASGDLPVFTPGQRDGLVGLNRVRFGALCFSPQYTIVLSPDVTEYTLEVTGFECVSAVFSVADAAGAPVRASAISSIAEPERARFRGHPGFSLRISKGQSGFVNILTSSRHLLVRLTPEQTTSDVALGTITAAPRVDGGHLTIDSTNVDELVTALMGVYSPGALLVSADGLSIFPITETLGRDESGARKMSFVNVSVPVGNFYVVPTGALWPAWARGLLDAIAAGADLSNSGVPMVTIAPGQHVTTNIDVMAAYRALFQLRRYSVQPQNP